MQTIENKNNIRTYHDFNNTAMGWALPAAIGSYFAEPTSPIICICGDGSFMMNIQEMAVIKHHKIPLKIFIMNNCGYSMIQQTQDQWLNSKYIASSKEGGLSFPNYEEIAMAFDFKYHYLDENNYAEDEIEKILISEQPCLCNVIVSPSARVIPQVKAGSANEDMEPLLERSIYKKLMITEPDSYTHLTLPTKA